MKTVVTVLSLTFLLAVMGCWPFERARTVEGVNIQAVDEGLVLKMSVPQRGYVRSQSVPVTLIAENTTDEDMTIQADSGALVSVSVWRHTAVGWQHFRTYPATAVMIRTRWVLPAEKARTFTLDLPVTADWPTGEYLRLVGHLNGKPCAAPAGLVQVWATQADRDAESAS